MTLDLFDLRADDNLDDDLRNGVWRGTVVGAAPGDVMMHVPYDKRIEVKNTRVVLTAPYHVEGLAMAVDPAKAATAPDSPADYRFTKNDATRLESLYAKI